MALLGVLYLALYNVTFVQYNTTETPDRKKYSNNQRGGNIVTLPTMAL